MNITIMIIIGVVAAAAMVCFGIIMRKVDAKLHNVKPEETKNDQNASKKNKS